MNTPKLSLVRPAAECRPWDEAAPACVKAYRVYYAYEGSNSVDPYQEGLVIEEWNDGRFYFLEFNTEYIGTLAECERLLQEYHEREHA